MKQNNPKIISTQELLYIFIFMFGFFALIQMHEQVHVEIYGSYGIDSHIEYISQFPNVVTIAERSCPSESCRLAHNINEAIGYPLMIFYVVFGLFGFIFLDKKYNSN